MRILLKPTKEGEGKYLDINLQRSQLPTLHGIQIIKIEVTAEDIHWLGTFVKGKDWFINHLMTKFVP